MGNKIFNGRLVILPLCITLCVTGCDPNYAKSEEQEFLYAQCKNLISEYQQHVGRKRMPDITHDEIIGRCGLLHPDKNLDSPQVLSYREQLYQKVPMRGNESRTYNLDYIPEFKQCIYDSSGNRNYDIKCNYDVLLKLLGYN